MKEDLVLWRPPKHTEGLKTRVVPACLCSSRLCALGESCSRADSGESLVTAAVETVPSQFLPCSAVTRAFHQKQSWWPASAAALLRDPCPSRLLLGMSSGACCADVTATPSRVPGDVTRKLPSSERQERAPSSFLPAPSISFRRCSLGTAPGERETRAVAVLKVQSKRATCSPRVPGESGCAQDGPVTRRNSAGRGQDPSPVC